MDKPLLLNHGTVEPEFGSRSIGPPEPARFWVLFWYAYVAALQSLIWLTYSRYICTQSWFHCYTCSLHSEAVQSSCVTMVINLYHSFAAMCTSSMYALACSVPDHSKTFLDVDESTLIWFLNEGPLAYCVAVPFVVRLLDSPEGLRKCVRAGATLCFLGAGIRCVPFLVADAFPRPLGHDFATGLVHLAQTLNAAAAPFVVASVSHLSLVWFDEAGRNTATAVANVASALGRAIGFYLGPAMVSRPTQLKGLLLLELGLAALALLAVFVHYPAQPVLP